SVSLWVVVVSSAALLLVGSGPSSLRAEIDTPATAAAAAAKLAGRHYLNQDPHYSRGPLSARVRTFVTGMTWLVAERRVAALPPGHPDLERLRGSAAASSVTWIGHATVLVQLDGLTILTDPTW